MNALFESSFQLLRSIFLCANAVDHQGQTIRNEYKVKLMYLSFYQEESVKEYSNGKVNSL